MERRPCRVLALRGDFPPIISDPASRARIAPLARPSGEGPVPDAAFDGGGVVEAALPGRGDSEAEDLGPEDEEDEEGAKEEKDAGGERGSEGFGAPRLRPR